MGSLEHGHRTLRQDAADTGHSWVLTVCWTQGKGDVPPWNGRGRSWQQRLLPMALSHYSHTPPTTQHTAQETATMPGCRQQGAQQVWGALLAGSEQPPVPHAQLPATSTSRHETGLLSRREVQQSGHRRPGVQVSKVPLQSLSADLCCLHTLCNTARSSPLLAPGCPYHSPGLQ